MGCRTVLFADNQPQEWLFASRTTPDISSLLQPLEDTVQMKLIPKLTRRNAPDDQERNVLALPARLGGMRIRNPTLEAI